MPYSASADPFGQPWTRSSVTAEINRLYNVIQAYPNPNNTAVVCTGVENAAGIVITPPDDAACRVLFNEYLGEIATLNNDLRQLQAIAANIAQGNIPSVVGPGAINVTTLPSGQQVFVTTPVAPPAVTVPPGTAGGSTSSSAQPGVGGPLPRAPSAGTGSSPATVAGTGTGANGVKTLPGFPFLPNVPKWIVISIALLLGYAVLNARTGR